MANEEEFIEEDASETKESFEEDMDNDEISPGEEGFMKGYDSAEEKEEKTEKQPEEKEE